MKVLCVVGARPNFVKIAPIMRAFLEFKKIRAILVHTGQHYDFEMSRSFFEKLEIPKPKYFLEVGSASQAEQTAKIMVEFEKVLLKENPDIVLVVGDVNSTLAAALVASKLHVPIAHVESGFRSFDRRMPEEINRVLTDHLSDLLFASSGEAVQNLLAEGIPRRKIFLAGDIMVDSISANIGKIKSSKIREILNLEKNSYALMTLHRQENADSAENLSKALEIIEKVSGLLKIVFVMHPRTEKNMAFFGLDKKLGSIENVIVSKPQNYIDFLKLAMDSKLVLTDSGGLQEEAFFLKKPCITLRKTTERNFSVETGVNILTGLESQKTVSAVKKILNGKKFNFKKQKFSDGKASRRIAKAISKFAPVN